VTSTSSPLHCADRSGFLFAHACDRPPASTCSRCQKPICVEHTRTTPSGPTCIGCLRRGTDDRSSASEGASTSTSSSSGTTAAATALAVGAGTFGGAGASGAWTGEGDARDDPYFQGSADRADYYDAEDFRAFDTAAASGDDAATTDGPESDTGAS
jgi:hypothetical protein